MLKLIVLLKEEVIHKDSTSHSFRFDRGSPYQKLWYQEGFIKKKLLTKGYS